MIDNLAELLYRRCNVLGFIICYMCFEFPAGLLFPFSNLFATHWCDVHAFKFKFLPPVRELSQNGHVSVLRPPYEIGKLLPNLFCSKNQQFQEDDGYTPIVKSETFFGGSQCKFVLLYFPVIVCYSISATSCPVNRG